MSKGELHLKFVQEKDTWWCLPNWQTSHVRLGIYSKAKKARVIACGFVLDELLDKL